jgi:chromate reductase, NAD(P)H dehydrogenase (quinone)
MQKLKKKILAISGSTRQNSTNHHLIKALAVLSHQELEISIFEDISGLPHFNPDNDNDNAPSKVIEFRRKLRTANGIIICTPEYAMGLPGTLKNALDWTVSSCEFSKKIVLAITASSIGQKAHQSLIGTLEIIEAQINNTQLLIPFAKTKISNDSKIIDEITLEEVKKVLANFIDALKVTESHN